MEYWNQSQKAVWKGHLTKLRPPTGHPAGRQPEKLCLALFFPRISCWGSHQTIQLKARGQGSQLIHNPYRSVSQRPGRGKEGWTVDPAYQRMVPLYTRPSDWVLSTLQYSLTAITPTTWLEIYRTLKTSHNLISQECQERTESMPCFRPAI